MMLYGRPIPNEELMERLSGITIERLTDLAGRLFFDTTPTLSAIGPLEKLAPMNDILGALSNKAVQARAANG
jgi:predicted Zn-dependent peptidase